MGTDGRGKVLSRRRGFQFIGDVGWLTAIEVDACPDFEVEKRKQTVGAVLTVPLVVGNETRNFAVSKQPARRDRVRGQQIANKRCQIAFEPGTHRCAEATLLSFEDVRRKHAL